MSQSLVMTYAHPPFNNPKADLIIRSSDGIHFRLRSDILSEASPVLAERFAKLRMQPQCADSKNSEDGASFISSSDGKPVIAVEEASGTLDPLFRLCYPTADPVLADLQDVRDVLAAAVKYQMEEAVLLMKKAHRAYLPSEPLRVWASACILRLEDEAREAAVALLGTEMSAKAPPEFNSLTSGDFFRLVKFQRAEGEVPDAFKFWEQDPSDLVAETTPARKTRAGPILAFQSRPYADIICRSSDGVDFHAHKIVLSLASSVFHDKIARLSSPQTSETSSGLPVLKIKATAAVASPLLELCYPTAHPDPDTFHLHHVVAIMKWAQHYKMEGVLEHVQRRLSWVGCVDDRPLSRYLLASKNGFSEWAREVLRSLRGDLYAYGYAPEMELTPATIYHTLFINRREISDMTAKVIKPAAPTSPSTRTPTKTGKVKSTVGTAPPEGDLWLLGLLQKMAHDLSNIGVGDLLSFMCPNIPSLLKESVTRKIWCRSCETNVRLMLEIRDLYERVSTAVYALERAA